MWTDNLNYSMCSLFIIEVQKYHWQGYRNDYSRYSKKKCRNLKNKIIGTHKQIGFMCYVVLVLKNKSSDFKLSIV